MVIRDYLLFSILLFHLKKLIYFRNKLIFICLSFVTWLPCSGQFINGKIVDKSETGIPYANIGIPSSGFGVTTNELGEFQFKITSEKETDTVMISSVGYKKKIMIFKELKQICESEAPVYLEAEVYELSAVTINGGDYETEMLGNKNTKDLKCAPFDQLELDLDPAKQNEYKRILKEKGVDDKAIGIELGNLVKIDKGQQTFIEQIEFKTCQNLGDTAVYRINVYLEGKKEKKTTVLGKARLIEFSNILKKAIIVKATEIEKTHIIDLSDQQLEVSDDFIVGLECIYSSNKQMNIGVKPALYGSTNLYIRFGVLDDWLKVPVIDVTFIGASVRYKKKKSFFKFWGD
jgi:CarboxypepD_reg-like domain